MAARVLLAGGTLLLAISSLRPLSTVGVDGTTYPLSVVDAAIGRTVDVQVHDTYFVAGGTDATWAARLLVAAVLATAVWILVRPSRVTLLGAGTIWAAVIAVYVRLGPGSPPRTVTETSWTSYPPLSTLESQSHVVVWVGDTMAIAGLAGGALLFTLAALRRPLPALGLLESPAEPENDAAGDQ